MLSSVPVYMRGYNVNKGQSWGSDGSTIEQGNAVTDVGHRGGMEYDDHFSLKWRLVRVAFGKVDC